MQRNMNHCAIMKLEVEHKRTMCAEPKRQYMFCTALATQKAECLATGAMSSANAVKHDRAVVGQGKLHP